MVVADNRAYDYSRDYLNTNTAVNKPEEPIKKQKQSPKRKQKPKVHIMSIIMIFSICIFIISRYAYIAELNFSIHKMEKEYKNASKVTSELNVELMKTVNLENLEKVAMKKLHMQYPDVTNQIVYVSVQQPVVERSEGNNSYSGIEDVKENKYLAYAKTAISSIIKVLD